MFRAIPLFSGSSGNCVYIQHNDEEILIDAGVSYKRICMALTDVGSDISRIKALLVTHEHSDHIKALDVLSKHTNIPIYINSKSAKAFCCQEDELFCGHAVIAEPCETLIFNGFEVNIFPTPHDSNGSVGYHFSFSDGERFALATDIGHMTKDISQYLLGCREIVLESNHDIKMLNNGPYPYLLKKRILSDRGHLSNEACAKLVPDLVEKGAKKIILAHLSEENNTPSLAYQTSAEALAEAGFTPDDVKLTVAMKSIV